MSLLNIRPLDLIAAGIVSFYSYKLFTDDRRYRMLSPTTYENFLHVIAIEEKHLGRLYQYGEEPPTKKKLEEKA